MLYWRLRSWPPWLASARVVALSTTTFETGALENGSAQGDEKRMSKKLFVVSLSWDTNDEGLRSAFSAHGEVSEAVVISDRDTGRSRGFGFVTFDDDEAADKAVAALNGTELDGRTIKVDIAQAKQRSGGGGGGGGGGGRGGYSGGW